MSSASRNASEEFAFAFAFDLDADFEGVFAFVGVFLADFRGDFRGLDDERERDAGIVVCCDLLSDLCLREILRPFLSEVK